MFFGENPGQGFPVQRGLRGFRHHGKALGHDTRKDLCMFIGRIATWNGAIASGHTMPRSS